MRLSQTVGTTRVRLMLVLALLASLSAPLTLPARSQSTTAAPPARQPAVGRAQADALSEAFRQVYRSTAPSVVNIRSIQRLEARPMGDQGGQPNPLDDEFFRRFFGQDAPEGFREFRFGQPNIPMPRERQGEGTGIIVRADGYVVTNNHVVADATTIRVRLDDDTEFEGTVVGSDLETDLAVIKVDASGLTPAHFGDSDTIEIGDWVLALGSPLGLRHTMTAGIVSAKGRGTLGLAEIGDFIQTDCAINPGNSGGPLVNLNGEVVGINTAISTRTGFYMGVGFAIPSNIIKPVINTIIEGGTIRRGWLGVSIGPVTPEAAEYAGFEGTRGVLISDVLPDGPALAAGLKPGDIVTQINGRTVTDPSQLLNIVAAAKPGDQVKLSAFRSGNLRDFTVSLGDRSEAQPLARNRPATAPGRQPGAAGLGIAVQNLTPDLSRRLGAEGREGVVVSRVAAGSPAAEQGIRAGDVISMVNETEIASVDDFAEAIREAEKGKVIRLQIFREGQTTLLHLKPRN